MELQNSIIHTVLIYCPEKGNRSVKLEWEMDCASAKKYCFVASGLQVPHA